MTAHTLLLLSLASLSLALVLMAALLLRRQRLQRRGAEVIQNALDRSAAGQPRESDGPAAAVPNRDEQLPAHWLDTRLGRLLVADEDRQLINQCGFPSVRAQLTLLLTRAALAVGLPLLVDALFVHGPDTSRKGFLLLATVFVVGFMLPKWLLQRLAARRRVRVSHELPLFVDLLGLLQSVGLSLDQSLQIIAKDFTGVIPILGNDVATANRQYNQGRTREHAFQRMADLHQNQHLTDLISLLIQVDKHGGAIQEPIRQFSERLRVHRKAEMKTRVGVITVKMTVVMVTTLLPALLIIVAGPGFLAVIRSLGSMVK